MTSSPNLGNYSDRVIIWAEGPGTIGIPCDKWITVVGTTIVGNDKLISCFYHTKHKDGPSSIIKHLNVGRKIRGISQGCVAEGEMIGKMVTLYTIYQENIIPCIATVH